MRVRAWSLCSLLLLCLQPFQATAGQEATARQEAAAANDNATTLEERRAALDHLQEAARLFLSAGEPIEAARTLNRAGRLQLLMNEPRKSIQAHNEALRLIQSSSDNRTEVDGLNGLAAALMRLQKADEAEAVLRRSISLSLQEGYTAGQAEALLTLSDRQNYVNHSLALQTAQQALSLWQTLNDKAAQARTHYQMGDCYLAQNLVSEATENYLAMLQLARELGDRSQEAAALIALGFAEYRKGNWTGEMVYLSQAQSLVDENDPFKMGQITFGLAEALSESGLPDQALIHFQQALIYLRQTQNPNNVGYALWQIGCTYYRLGNYSEAITQLNLALAADEPDGILAAQCHEFLGRIYLATGDRTAALSHLQLALNVYSKTANPKEAAQARAIMGQVFEQQGQFQRAADYYKQALTAFEKLSDTVNAATVYYALGKLELNRGDYDSAEKYLSQSVSFTENLRRVSTSRDLAAAFSANVHERYVSYIECLMRKHYANPAEDLNVRAFETSELARGRSLAELLRSTQTNLVTGIDPQLAEREKSLRQSLRVKEDYRVTLLGTSYKKGELDALEKELSRLESEYQQVTATIRAQYPAYAQVTKPLAWTLPQIQKHVVADDQTLLLEYSLGAQQSYLWVVSRTELLSYELPGRAEIESEARRFYDLLTATQPKPGLTLDLQQERVRQAEGQLPAVTATLSKLLLGPVADKLGTKRLLIVADGPLQYIPFQVLVLPGKTDPNASSSQVNANEQRRLISDHEIINEPSASILALVLSESANRRPPDNTVAVLADPVFESDDPRIASAGRPAAGSTGPDKEIEFHQALRDVNLSGDGHIPRLLASRDEADAIMSVAPWRSGFQAMDFEASRATVMKTDLSGYRVVHFATHGLLNNEHPELSGVVLSLFDRKGQPQDGFLRLHDIYNLKLPVDLVVLSACNTGLGKDVKGEGLIGLTRGFMYAGASSVVASLWKVDDEATAELMRLFYGYMLRDGLSAAAALRKAQLTMSQQKRWQAPYYWAGFVIQGQYLPSQRVSRFPFSHLALWLIPAALVSAAGLYALRRRRKILV